MGAPGARNIASELEALKAGDEDAFRALIQRYHGAILRLAMTYVGDREAAEDVVQETWLAVLRGVRSFEGRSSLKTWVFGIAINVARSRRRKESRILSFTSLFQRRDESGPTVDPSRFGAEGMWRSLPDSWPEGRLIGAETLQRVKEAIDALPPKQREVIVMRDVAGMEAGEVAELIGISAENQRVRLHRARAAVRRVLEDYLR